MSIGLIYQQKPVLIGSTADILAILDYIIFYNIATTKTTKFPKNLKTEPKYKFRFHLYKFEYLLINSTTKTIKISDKNFGSISPKQNFLI